MRIMHLLLLQRLRLLNSVMIKRLPLHLQKMTMQRRILLSFSETASFLQQKLFCPVRNTQQIFQKKLKKREETDISPLL